MLFTQDLSIDICVRAPENSSTELRIGPDCRLKLTGYLKMIEEPVRIPEMLLFVLQRGAKRQDTVPMEAQGSRIATPGIGSNEQKAAALVLVEAIAPVRKDGCVSCNCEQAAEHERPHVRTRRLGRVRRPSCLLRLSELRA